jgi:hypothetical protein
MALEFPKYPGDVSDGDEHSHSPHKTHDSILATERGTDYTRRIETDANRNVYVNVASNSALPASVDTLATGTQTGVAANLLTTIVTFTAGSAKKITKVSVSGTEYAKFQLFKNTGLIETKRTGPDRSVDFIFNSPLVMNTGDILDVKVTHFYIGNTLEVEASIYGA